MRPVYCLDPDHQPVTECTLVKYFAVSMKLSQFTSSPSLKIGGIWRCVDMTGQLSWSNRNFFVKREFCFPSGIFSSTTSEEFVQFCSSHTWPKKPRLHYNMLERGETFRRIARKKLLKFVIMREGTWITNIKETFTVVYCELRKLITCWQRKKKLVNNKTTRFKRIDSVEFFPLLSVHTRRNFRC